MWLELDTLTRPFSFLIGVSGAERLPWPGRGSIITSVKLLARSSVELLEDKASATSKPGSFLALTLKSGLRILLVGVLGSLKDKGTV